jgi:hypothetical protein
MHEVIREEKETSETRPRSTIPHENHDSTVMLLYEDVERLTKNFPRPVNHSNSNSTLLADNST